MHSGVNVYKAELAWGLSWLKLLEHAPEAPGGGGGGGAPPLQLAPTPAGATPNITTTPCHRHPLHFRLLIARSTFWNVEST